jgi:protein AroM
MSKILGTITIGQSPRRDVIPEMEEFFGIDTKVIEAGALDGLTLEEIEKFAPNENDYVLVSKLRDGTSVRFGEQHILPRLQECINLLETKGADIILFICTGVFPDVFKSSVPLLYPQKMIHGLVPSLLDKGKLAVITPDKSQVKQSVDKWSEVLPNIIVVSASPYTIEDDFSEAIETIKTSDADVVVMDCMGYTNQMKKRVAEETGKVVILSRTIVARVIGEMLSY